MKKIVMYIDEAGRGPLAGPVYVGLVLLKKRIILKGFKDSKKCSEAVREKLYDRIVNHTSVHWTTAKCDHDMIDIHGISYAIQASIHEGLERLLQGFVDKKVSGLKNIIKHIGKENIKIMLDGKYDFQLRSMLGVEVETVVNGDDKIPQIGMASILAKVERDREMIKLHKKYPIYGFKKHKGYGTQEHRDCLINHGPCKIHRKTFLVKLNNQYSLSEK